MASRFAERGPTFGSACAWSKTRDSPTHRIRRSGAPRSSTRSTAGCDSGAIGRPESTIIDVSLLRKTSSMKWLIEKHSRGSDSPHWRCGNPVQKSRAVRARRRRVPVVEEVSLDVEHELVAGQRGSRRRRDRWRPWSGSRRCRRACGPWWRFDSLLEHAFEREQRGRRAAHRRQEVAAGHPGAPGVAVAVVERLADRGLDDAAARQRIELAVRTRPELDWQSGIFLPMTHDCSVTKSAESSM